MTSSGGVAAPGWYPDPAGSGGWRWWDGGAWSQIVSGLATQPRAPTLEEYDSARRAAQNLRRWYWVRTAALVLTALGFTIALRSFFDFVEEVDRTTSDSTGAPSGLFVMFAVQPLSLLSLVVVVLEAIWIYRAAQFAAMAGLPGPGVAPRHSPGLGAASLIIPVLQWWWPWEAVCDMLPPDHPARRQVGVWWVLQIASGLVFLFVFPLALAPLPIAIADTLALSVLPIAELVALWRMLDQFTAVHDLVASEIGMPVSRAAPA